MSEQNQPPEDETIDIVEIHSDLLPRLHLYTTQDAATIYELINTLPGRVGTEACAARTRELLAEARTEQVREIKNQFCSQVAISYPAGSEDDPNIESPKHFIKNNGLDGRIRRELRQAQADTISASRDRLVDKIQADTYHETLPFVLDDEELEDKVKEKTFELVRDVNRLVLEIKERIPEHRVDVGRLGAGVLRAMQYGDVAGVIALSLPDTNRGLSLLDNALFALKQTLTNLHNAEEYTAQVICEEAAPEESERLACLLEEHYERLETEERNVLPVIVEAAYVAAAKLGPQYKPKTPVDTSEAHPVSEVLAEESELEPSSPEITVENLGKIEGQFEWAADESTDLQLLRMNGDILLVCSALSAPARSISEKVRGETIVAKKLDDMWQRVKSAELQEHGLQHPLIKAVHHPDFHNLTIRYFSNHRNNGLRTYYTRVKGAQYPAVREAIEMAGLSPDTDLIILLAETDKANQEKIFQEFNL